MLATPWREPFSDDEWLFEPKWDGYRVILTFDGEAVTLRSRRGNDLTSRFPELTRVDQPAPVVLDGEIVVLEDGVPSFDRLQQRTGRLAASPDAEPPRVSCIVFDLLHLDDRPLVSDPIETRQAALTELGLADPFAIAEPVVGAGLDLWAVIVDRDLEGMVAKRSGSTYRPAARSPDWRKIHNIHAARAVVGGFTTGEGGRAGTFGALLVGMWEGRLLRWTGAVGSGFTDSDLAAIRSALDAQRRVDSPFQEDPALPDDAVWVEPSLVASIGYRSWTSAGRLRHPRFRGFTDDPPASVTWEAEGPSA
jgi:bifunctional non-homologous end joining protein LigD